MQQMRIQAIEQRQRRLAEQSRLQRERDQRVQAELERDRLRSEMDHLVEQLNAMQSVVKSAEETQQLIAERAKISEKEAMEMAKRASEAEAEMQRIKISHLRAEESKMLLERKVQDAEVLAQRLIQQQQRQQNGNGTSIAQVYQQKILLTIISSVSLHHIDLRLQMANKPNRICPSKMKKTNKMD